LSGANDVDGKNAPSSLRTLRLCAESKEAAPIRRAHSPQGAPHSPKSRQASSQVRGVQIIASSQSSPPTGSAAHWERRLSSRPTGSAANWERGLSSRPTGSAGFPAGQLGAPAFQPANWERRLSSRPLGAPAFQPATGSAGFPAGQLGAPAFQPASPDAGSMPASGDLAAEAILHLPSRMFSSDGFSSGSRVFAISHVFGTALSRAKDVPAGKPALPVAGAPSKPAFPVR
jgi:hypothetical protein